jgi:molecular chaperone DnaK
MAIAGIDLGTTNTVVAVWRKGQPHTVKIEGSSLFPSVVYFQNQNTRWVGARARRMAMIDPDHTVTGIKRHMGKSGHFINMFGKKYSPVEISSIILQEVVEKAGKEIGEAITEAVITVPAYFSMEACMDTMDAAKLAGERAGFKVSRLIKEPTAAAIALGFHKKGDGFLLVYDLGGGTFDVSILEVKGNQYEVKATAGNTKLGGDDFDERIMLFLIQQMDEKHACGLNKQWQEEPAKRAPAASRAFQCLKEYAESIKWTLSHADITEINIPDVFEGHGLGGIELTRKDFAKMTRHLIKETEEGMDQAIKDAGMRKSQIDSAILVGGSTRMPAVKSLVAKVLREPFMADQVDEMVAMGAAIVAASAHAPDDRLTEIPAEEKERLPEIIIERTAHSYGIQTIDLDDSGTKLVTDRFSPIVPKATAIPCKIEEGPYTTVLENQSSVSLPVFRGENPHCRNNEKIGDMLLENISEGKAGTPKIFITMEIDASNVLSVFAIDKVSGSSVSVSLSRF